MVRTFARDRGPYHDRNDWGCFAWDPETNRAFSYTFEDKPQSLGDIVDETFPKWVDVMLAADEIFESIDLGL